jgi:hypothetical protein
LVGVPPTKKKNHHLQKLFAGIIILSGRESPALL